MTTPTTVEAVCAALRAEAETLLDQAAENDRVGRKGNAAWARAAAYGYLRATAVVRRLG